ncbi:MAG TPA: mechanosensitive ion channel domain-containing protein [Bryobacteraceae bacterium]|nr:mechanosensitive ion channel domain-containing protein [Bryobacteraceae bacterium]
MKRFRNLPAIGLALSLAACVAGWFITRGAGEHKMAASPSSAASQASLIDQRLLETAQSMAALPETAPEQDLAREALRLTDHELDQAFATALREATAPTVSASGPLAQLNARIAQIRARMAAGQKRIAQLTKDAAASDTAADQLELARAQSALDQDELDDARQDLARQGGDEHARLERALQEHEAAQHQAAQPVRFPGPAPAGTLGQQARAWLELGGLRGQLLAAETQSGSQASTLARAHDTLDHSLSGKSGPDAGGDAEAEETAVLVARLQHLSDQRKTLTELDHRIQDCQQVADVYRRWSAIVESRRVGVLHLLLRSLTTVLAILLGVVLLSPVIRRTFAKQADRRKGHQLRVMSMLAIQVVAAMLILFVIFGPPTQLATMIGFATAGLTVVLKDFIVAFIGWFALMGKHGIRVGDFVEINGVGGEVIEVGVLRTVLLEMGNWTVKGHPTGRRVAFVNSFAIEGQYFNFSTTGQWLWDELMVTLPAGGDPYQMSQQIREVVERETADDAVEAEQDWQRVTHQYGMRAFSAKPAAELRPSPTGLEVVVRYITRAPERHHVKSRLFERIVELLHKSAQSAVNTA